MGTDSENLKRLISRHPNFEVVFQARCAVSASESFSDASIMGSIVDEDTERIITLLEVKNEECV